MDMKREDEITTEGIKILTLYLEDLILIYQEELIMILIEEDKFLSTIFMIQGDNQFLT